MSNAGRSWANRLLGVGSIAESMGVYLPSMVFQKALGMGRLILFTYFVSREQMGVWSSGVMVFILGAPLLSLGTSHALVRYVSAFEQRGRLIEFYRRSRLYVLVIVVALAGLSLAGCESMLEWLSHRGWAAQVVLLRDSRVRLAVLGNAILMALYLAQVSFMYGLRTYRLVSATEVAFSVFFTVGALAWVAVTPTAHALLLAHMLSLAVVMVINSALLGLAVQRIAAKIREAPDEAIRGRLELEIAADAEGDSVSGKVPLLRREAPPESLGARPVGWLRMFRFGLIAMFGAFVWQATQYVSYFLVLRRYGETSAGGFWVMMQFAQPLVFLANAAWAVLFSYVAQRWESDDRPGAMFVLETSYKAVALTIMTFTVLLYSTSPWWIRVLNVHYQYGRQYLSGLLVFFLSVSNMTMLTIPARLHERPSVIALAALGGTAMNALLAILWMAPGAEGGWGEVGAARAAGVGMFFGGGLVMLVYLLASGTRLEDSTYFVLGTPVLLLLPTWLVGPLWAAIIPVSVFSKWIFDTRQKKVLAGSLKRLWPTFQRIAPWSKRSP